MNTFNMWYTRANPENGLDSFSWCCSYRKDFEVFTTSCLFKALSSDKRKHCHREINHFHRCRQLPEAHTSTCGLTHCCFSVLSPRSLARTPIWHPPPVHARPAAFKFWNVCRPDFLYGSVQTPWGGKKDLGKRKWVKKLKASERTWSV